jgi:hypothetical protein
VRTVITKIRNLIFWNLQSPALFPAFLYLFSHHRPVFVSTITTAATIVNERQILNALVYAGASEGTKVINGTKAAVLPSPICTAVKKPCLK